MTRTPSLSTSSTVSIWLSHSGFSISIESFVVIDIGRRSNGRAIDSAGSSKREYIVVNAVNTSPEQNMAELDRSICVSNEESSPEDPESVLFSIGKERLSSGEREKRRSVRGPPVTSV